MRCLCDVLTMLDRDSYKDVFEGLIGGSEVLNNITDGLAAAVGL